METDRADGLPSTYLITHSGWNKANKFYTLSYQGNGTWPRGGVDGGGYGAADFTNYARPRADFQTDELDLVGYQEVWFDQKGRFHWYSARPQTLATGSMQDPPGIPSDTEYSGLDVDKVVVTPAGKGKVSITGAGGGTAYVSYQEATGNLEAVSGVDRITGNLRYDKDGTVYFSYGFKDRTKNHSASITAKRYSSGDANRDALLATSFAALDELGFNTGWGLDGALAGGVFEPLAKPSKKGGKPVKALPLYFTKLERYSSLYNPSANVSYSYSGNARGTLSAQGLISSLSGDESSDDVDRNGRYSSNRTFRGSFSYGTPAIPGTLATRSGLGESFRGLMASMYGVADKVMRRFSSVQLPAWAQFEAGLSGSGPGAQPFIGQLDSQGIPLLSSDPLA